MSCVLYNIVKEGFAANLTTAPVDQLTDAQILALYDGDTSTPAVTISGAASLGLVFEFGESYDVCYVDYYTDETTPSNISVKWGTTSGTQNTATLTLHAAGVYRATVSGVLNFVDLRHTLTAISTDINQVEIISVKNETLGFGTSVTDQTEQLYLKHATIGGLSATANVIPLFNDNHFEETIKIAVAPTLTPADRYLYLATEEDGPYYGIDEYGIQQPGPDPMTLVDDPMDSATEIHPQWERRMGYNANTITPTPEGVLIDAGADTNAPSANVTSVGLLTKDYFTPSSFTAEIQVRFLDSHAPFSDEERPFYFAITNGMYIHDIAFFEAFRTDGHLGFTTAGIGLTAHRDEYNTKDAFNITFAHIDGRRVDNPYDGVTNNAQTGWFGVNYGTNSVGEPGYFSKTKGPTFSEREDYLNLGQDMNDFTASAEWHTWRLVYDHIKQEVTGYYDKVRLGSAILKTDVFHEGVKLFVGGAQQNGWKTVVRNFKIYPNKIYRQKVVSLPENGGVFSASVSGVAYNLDRITDGNSSTMYVAPDPDEFTTIRVDFDDSYDICNYYIHQRHTGQNTETIPTVFGVKHNQKTATTAVVDYGGKESYTNFYPPAVNDYYDSRPADRRAPTWVSALAETPTVSGINYMEWRFVDYSTGWIGFPDFAMHIREMYVYAEEWADATYSQEESSPTKIRWSEGRWRNLKQVGNAGALVLSDPRHVESMYWPTPEYVFDGIDYGTSSAEYRSQTGNGTYLNPGTETLISSPANTHTNAQVDWHSEIQTQPEPFYFWRRFAEEINLTVISARSNTFVNQTVAKEFKFQYLKEGGNPNTEEGWEDIPPMTKEYVQESNDITDAALRYNEYKKYKIANNDGEYYTNNHLQVISVSGDPGGVGSFALGQGGNSIIKVLTDKVPSGYRNLDAIYNASASAGDKKSALIVELDEPIRTRGIRLVVKNPVVLYNTNAEQNRFSLYEFQAWGTSGNGSYISPVFDTLTAQNTERLVVDYANYPTTTTDVFVRSYNLPPQQRYDLAFETWEPLGALGQPDYPVSTTDTRGRVITIGDESHFIIADHYVYNHKLDTWSQPYGSYPSQATGGPTAGDTFDTADLGPGVTTAMRPDPSVDDRVALIDGVIYVACEETTLTGSDRLMYLDLNSDSPVWISLGGNRPLETTDATMCAYQKRLYFFNRYGPVYYWDTVTANWFFVEDTLPQVGGDRKRVSSVLVGNKIYLFGSDNTDTAAASREVSIFDPEEERFASGTPAPYAMRQVQPIATEDGTIYVLSKNSRDMHQKYFPGEDRWEPITALSWNRDYTAGGIGGYFFYYDGYIYKVWTGYQGLARTLVRKNAWESGKSPAARDVVWGKKSELQDIPWRRMSGLGELMPQERYLQFKVEMHSDDRKESPVLAGVKIVSPQSITIPASGTSSAFLKVSATERVDYHLWYSGKSRLLSGVTLYPGNSFTREFVHDWSVLYTHSSAPEKWSQPVTASGFYTYYSPANNISVWTDGFAPRSPWVVLDGTGGYDCWYVLADVSDQEYYNSPAYGQPGGSSIHYINTREPADLSANNLSQVVVAPETVPQGRLNWHPTVVVHGSTDQRMWFTAQDATAGVSAWTALPYQRIIYAESSDKVTWTNHQTVIDIGEDTTFGYDAQAVYRPCVLYDGSIYRIWYTGQDVSGIDRILYRESTDGISWGAIQVHVNIATQGPSDLHGASRPHVVKDSTTYYLFYFGYDGSDYVIIRAESSDGVGWVNFVVVASGFGIEGRIDSEGIDDFFVLAEEDIVTPGDSLTTGKLKIYNEGTGI